jgi:hypothetical protein
MAQLGTGVSHGVMDFIFVTVVVMEGVEVAGRISERRSLVGTGLGWDVWVWLE